MFNEFSTFWRKLTYAQAKQFAICLSALIGFFFGTIILISIKLPSPITSITTLLIACSFYFFGFKPKLFIKRLDEENEKAKKQLIEEFNLTKENYTKVNFSFEELLKGAPNKHIGIALLENANYSFYVKIIYDSHHEKDALELIIKDVNENIVYEESSISFRIWQKYIKKADY